MTVPEYDVFVSHSSQDLPQAREIVGSLEAAKFRVWFALERLPPGEPALVRSAASESRRVK
jgi:hypothetical protein